MGIEKANGFSCTSRPPLPQCRCRSLTLPCSLLHLFWASWVQSCWRNASLHTCRSMSFRFLRTMVRMSPTTKQQVPIFYFKAACTWEKDKRLEVRMINLLGKKLRNPYFRKNSDVLLTRFHWSQTKHTVYLSVMLPLQLYWSILFRISDKILHKSEGKPKERPEE